MKYVWIIVGIIMLVRIDEVATFFNKQFSRLSTFNSPPVSVPEDLPVSTLIPIDKDQVIQATPSDKFFISLENFQIRPESELAKGVIEILRSHPTLFSSTLDARLEGHLISFRNHLQQNNPVVISFFLEMMKSLTGENLSMARRVLTIAFDSELDSFLTHYMSSNDSNCIISGEFIDNISSLEKINELQERKLQLDKILLNEGYPNNLKSYAQRCLMVTNLAIDRLRGPETNQ